jgi:hypothetical protein
MGTLATLARFEAKPGKETEVEVFLREALPPVQAEPATKAPELFVEPRTFKWSMESLQSSSKMFKSGQSLWRMLRLPRFDTHLRARTCLRLGGGLRL